jgi:monoamine oxidase
MNMSVVEHLIIGGGISGCAMARQLAKYQLDFKLIEAQTNLGGRIQSTPQGLDLGPTWYWPHQHSVKALLSELQLDTFDQYTQGDYVYQQAHNTEISRGRDAQSMLSHRVVGGMGAIINALSKTIPADNIVLNCPVTHITKQDELWQVILSNGDTLICKHLWLAMPPRKVAQLFKPVLNEAALNEAILSTTLISHLHDQQTWMSAQAKFVAEYETPFWRDTGLSGQGFSQVGPMVEINDASGVNRESTSISVGESVNNDARPAALFGFIGVPSLSRKAIDKQQIINACIAQLGKLFGEAALTPISTHYIDWANNEYISTNADINEPSQHAHFDQARFKAELNRLNLGLIGSEFSQTEPGYISGALDHVNDQAAKIKNS